MVTRQNTLSKADDFKLMSLMTEELSTYTEGVGAFVVYAREKLGIPQLNKDHIYFRAKELDIPLPQAPLRAAVVAADPRVNDLEAMVTRLVSDFHFLIERFKTVEAKVAELERLDLTPLYERVSKLEKQFDVFKLAAKHNIK